MHAQCFIFLREDMGIAKLSDTLERLLVHEPDHISEKIRLKMSLNEFIIFVKKCKVTHVLGKTDFKTFCWCHCFASHSRIIFVIYENGVRSGRGKIFCRIFSNVVFEKSE